MVPLSTFSCGHNVYNISYKQTVRQETGHCYSSRCELGWQLIFLILWRGMVCFAIGLQLANKSDLRSGFLTLGRAGDVFDKVGKIPFENDCAMEYLWNGL